MDKESIDLDRIWKVISQIDKTLDNPRQLLTKEAVIETMKEHIKDLKSCLSPSSDAVSVEPGPDLVKDETRNDVTFDESILSNWKVCTCGEDSCGTCRAEEEATKLPKGWSLPQEVGLPNIDSQSEVSKPQGTFSSGALAGDEQQEGSAVSDQVKRSISEEPTGASEEPQHVPYTKANSFPNDDMYGIDTERQLFPSENPYDPSQPVSHGDQQSFSPYMGGYSQPLAMQRVVVITDSQVSGMDGPTKIICKLNPKISASGLQDQPGHPNACSVIALLFADKLIKAPQKGLLRALYQKYYLSDEAFEMVLSSIQEGLEIYTANFEITTNPPPPQLSPQQTILLSSHLGRSIKEEMEFQDGLDSAQLLINYMVNLTSDQIILLYRMEGYRVISIFSKPDHRGVYLFDCQGHQDTLPETDQTTEYGASIYEVSKDQFSLGQVLCFFQDYTGLIMGHCKVVLLE